MSRAEPEGASGTHRRHLDLIYLTELSEQSLEMKEAEEEEGGHFGQREPHI